MLDQTVVYLGKAVSRKNFRAFVYAPDNTKKLVNSWDEFQECMKSGLWFDSPVTEDELEEIKPVKRKKKNSAIEIESGLLEKLMEE